MKNKKNIQKNNENLQSTYQQLCLMLLVSDDLNRIFPVFGLPVTCGKTATRFSLNLTSEKRPSK